MDFSTPQWGNLVILHMFFEYSVFVFMNESLIHIVNDRNKKERKSYVEICESVGVHKPSDVLFVTDVFQEAVAAKAAGR